MGGDLYSGLQSALAPRGPQADRIEDLWWLFLGVSVLVWLAVAGALYLALWRRGRLALPLRQAGEPGKGLVVAAATGVTALILLGLITASAFVSRATAALPSPDRRPITVDVIGHQWWWEIVYEGEPSSRRFRTANELHVPVGRPVIIRATSRDVIHSFWVPNLHGKIDLIPGRTNTTWLQADEAGEYRGQCAEFCGIQHAKMGLIVVAESEDAFERWAEAQRRPAEPPVDAVAQRGESVFLQNQCALCHAIRGTGAWGMVAPDLTRIGSRRTVGAGTLRNTRGNLAGWIANPQTIKPGNHMPPTNLPPEDFHALLAYLESLR